MKLALLGDVHGEGTPIVRSFELLKKADMVIQLGDFGYGPWPSYPTGILKPGGEKYLDKVDPDKYKIMFGNHENPQSYKTSPHFLGRYGSLTLGKTKIFFIGGASSTDRERRIEEIDWWYSEELSWFESNDCIEKCIDFQPDIILSHDCPVTIAHVLASKKGIVLKEYSNTQRMLTEIEKHCKPCNWYFGHWHITWQKKLGDTVYRCLNINEHCIINV